MPHLHLHKIRLHIESPQPCILDLGNFVIKENARARKRTLVTELLEAQAEIDPNSDIDCVKGVVEFPTAFIIPPVTGRFKFTLVLSSEPPSDNARIFAQLTIYN